MKKSSRKAPCGLLTIESLQPYTRVRDLGQKPREFIPLTASLYGPTEEAHQQRLPSKEDTFQHAVAPPVGYTPDPWGAKKAIITQLGEDGKSLKTTSFRWKVEKRGRRKKLTAEERPQRKQQQNTKAQRGYSGRRYLKQFQEAYREGERKLRAKKKATPQSVRALKKGIIGLETTPHTGMVKREALNAFEQWVEEALKRTEPGHK